MISYSNEGKSSFLFYSKLNENMPWNIGATIPKSELTALANEIVAIMIILFIVSIIIIFIAVGYAIRVLVIRRVRKFVEKFEIGISGNLTVRINDSSKDEIGELSTYFNSFMEKVSQMVVEINETSGKITDFSKLLLNEIEQVVGQSNKYENEINILKLKNAMETVLENVSSQTAATQESASSLNIISTALKTVVQNAKETANIAVETTHFAKVGGEAFKKSLNGMATIENTVKEIDSLIHSIQKGALDVQNSTKIGYNEVVNNKKLASEAENNLNHIFNKIDQTNEEVENISNAIQEQSNAITEISIAIDNVAEGSYNINSLSENQTNGLNQISKQLNHVLTSSVELTDVIEKLDTLVKQFKIK